MVKNEKKTTDNSSFSISSVCRSIICSSYNVSLYTGVNLPWTQENARKALQWERRLEFAMESPRFHDLVRWGIAAETLNAYIAVEKTRHPYLSTAVFTKGRDEYLPIPQIQIDLVDGRYIQNPKY